MKKDYKLLHFTKMHGLGNDYIYFDLVTEAVEDVDWQKQARLWSDRHTGIGGDGIVLILPSKTCDFRMRIFNADGSEAEMCGNASRCIGKYVYEHGLTDKTDLTLETCAGEKRLIINAVDGAVQDISVDMGVPAEVRIVRECGIEGIEKESLTVVNMGNPHAVMIADGEPETRMVHEVGARVEKATMFPKGTNVEFVQVVSRSEIRMRVWERGSGETMACGTGACASVVAARESGLVDSTVTVHLPGGDLKISILDNGHVIMRGGATEVFGGEINL